MTRTKKKYKLTMLKLFNIIKTNNFKYFNKNEIIELIEFLISVLYIYILNNPLIFMFENYNNTISKYLYDILYIQLFHINKLENIDTEILKIVDITKIIFNSCILPKRSYLHTFTYIKPNLNNLHNKLTYLQNIYQPAQRTDEWYKFRHNTLTASSIWKIFKSNASINQLIFEKCEPYKEYNKPNIDSPMHWGQKYEPVSIMYYEKYYKTKISDFGCIQHPKYSFIAASPDGINTEKSSNLYGRMLEIKNIFNRKINGNPKFEYWIQMQLQMEVCNLNECDFLETKFIEYINEEEFNNDGTFKKTQDNKYKGIILLFKTNNDLKYEYMPFDLSYDEFLLWKNNIIQNSSFIYIKDIYWKLEVISCVLVLRNEFWFKSALPIIENNWYIICNEKINGYMHRAPKKREKPQPICLIDNNLFSS